MCCSYWKSKFTDANQYINLKNNLAYIYANFCFFLVQTIKKFETKNISFIEGISNVQKFSDKLDKTREHVMTERVLQTFANRVEKILISN